MVYFVNHVYLKKKKKGEESSTVGRCSPALGVGGRWLWSLSQLQKVRSRLHPGSCEDLTRAGRMAYPIAAPSCLRRFGSCRVVRRRCRCQQSSTRMARELERLCEYARQRGRRGS